MSTTILCVLNGGPDQALRCLTALASLRDQPDHEVVLVDDGTVGLEDLFARVEGDVALVRRPQRDGLLASVADGLARAEGDVVVVVRDAAEVAPDFLAPLLEALDGRAAVTTHGAPVAAYALAARRDVLRDAVTVARETPVDESLAVASLVAALSRVGAVEPVAASVVAPPRARTGAARAQLGADPEVSIVVPTLDVTSPRVQETLRAIQERTDVPHELIVVDNGAPPQGFSAPVNSGLRAARGRYMVVMNDDVEVLPGWWEPLRDALDAGAPVAFPLTIDGAMRHDFAAWCFALSRATLDEFAAAPGEFLEPEFRVWFQDTDLLHRLRLAERPPVLVDRSQIRHGLSLTVATTEPELRAWIDAQIVRDKAAFEARWGSGVAGAAR
ncbi:glycosyltransferase family 2 protein [Svornostia abyssi]|uniref:Glycosyltransferase family 2 protein n=1 Tax=Svornostia abyssi TaxID=2898438 RepID=A0ABY5PJC0_9ACTN|nr:glycosyltransferase family 2 protein [Parviterribacteraceae bacterium J379]